MTSHSDRNDEPASDNIETPVAKQALKDLNFKVPEEFHYEFKMFAVTHRMSNVELLRKAFVAIKRELEPRVPNAETRAAMAEADAIVRNRRDLKARGKRKQPR